jgi:hypothetical protein
MKWSMWKKKCTFTFNKHKLACGLNKKKAEQNNIIKKKKYCIQDTKCNVIYSSTIERFLCKKMSLSTLSGARRDRLALTMSPAVEKILSLGTEVPGTQRRRFAAFATWGNLHSLVFHHMKGSASTPMESANLYEATSSSTIWERA